MIVLERTWEVLEWTWYEVRDHFEVVWPIWWFFLAVVVIWS